MTIIKSLLSDNFFFLGLPPGLAKFTIAIVHNTFHFVSFILDGLLARKITFYNLLMTLMQSGKDPLEFS